MHIYICMSLNTRPYLRIIIIIINQGTNARRCPMPFSLFDAIFVSPKQRGIVLVLMHHTSLLYCPTHTLLLFQSGVVLHLPFIQSAYLCVFYKGTGSKALTRVSSN